MINSFWSHSGTNLWKKIKFVTILHQIRLTYYVDRRPDPIGSAVFYFRQELDLSCGRMAWFNNSPTRPNCDNRFLFCLAVCEIRKKFLHWDVHPGFSRTLKETFLDKLLLVNSMPDTNRNPICRKNENFRVNALLVRLKSSHPILWRIIIIVTFCFRYKKDVFFHFLKTSKKHIKFSL